MEGETLVRMPSSKSNRKAMELEYVAKVYHIYAYPESRYVPIGYSGLTFLQVLHPTDGQT